MKEIVICIYKKDLCKFKLAVSTLKNLHDYEVKCEFKEHEEIKEYLCIYLGIDEIDLAALYYLGLYFKEYENLPF